ncbi:MAG: aconitate hydratase AcnA [Deltaproteobacteria bacterium]|nr:MAG: aconitate hydratase AcnA [Deltaproteobacteria bacterium]
MFQSVSEVSVGGEKKIVYSLKRAAGEEGLLRRLPYSVKILLENALRGVARGVTPPRTVERLLSWDGKNPVGDDFPFLPSRVVLQDFTGVPAVVDLASMRDAIKAQGGDPAKINPVLPCDLVIDHSIQVDYFGLGEAFLLNARKEFERNRERYSLLKWAQRSFENFRVVPPNTGIVHQVNLEFLSRVVMEKEVDGEKILYPDTLVGTDSHTTMINGLGVLGWGVGGIEAEAVMLGQPYFMLVPEVIGVRLTGELPPGATATDLVLTVTELLRKKGVVGKFVEYFGPGVSRLSVADRATLSNMSPEYGATVGIFPVDEKTLDYLRLTGREDLVPLVEAYCREQGLWFDPDAEPVYTDVVELDLSSVEPVLAGPRRPQDRVTLSGLKENFLSFLEKSGKKAPERGDHEEACWAEEGGCVLPQRHEAWEEELHSSDDTVRIETPDGIVYPVTHGSVVIAAVTSCTNTSNPAVMMAAGLLARNAVRRGLQVKPWVKTSLAPGSRAVTDYLSEAGLLPYLEALRFHVVGYGCTTCIGNSGPLPPPIAKAVTEGDLVVASVLSGNRNFEGRINNLVRANYLASPPLVVAYALAGRVDVDLEREPLGHDTSGKPVYLREIWPSREEVEELVARHVTSVKFRETYSDVFSGSGEWQELPVPEGALYEWEDTSTYIKNPPYFEDFSPEPPPLEDIRGARVLVLLGDSVTTDHISPAGAIPVDSPAGRYLLSKGVKPEEFNTYGSRRGNHEVMIRGTFGNVRLRNLLLDGVEGGRTVHLPDGEEMWIFDAAEKYSEEGVPLIVIAGKEYGTGSSRDWAAKGTRLLGVRAVLAESFERIHRSNLIGMGVLPLQFLPGQGRESLGLTGREEYTIEGITDLKPGGEVTVTAVGPGGEKKKFTAVARIDSDKELHYYRNGGILPAVLREFLRGEK